ncbi:MULTISPECIES: 1-(5-phosphoribosyl)-5-[(5-phosphoribosylamino)methylideneamino]imidazole-4-carboxamide isomerase [Persicobacter]|uniref:1-(5-phosphoribosyl)-5-[(5-phosphoribosylamino)methylideneamino] imidazole-4-carboxamide isomerase n=1 Tax=Persicobacter diffluens TaxID=981 RepID=A0AAN5AJP5_9BACT|nr:1-(5-phosphoribosyl)-5-[(5-phosphoribosylamino)methylideneamino]imidazole-4-carboxamide isomerase [Persicobacter sp. CCB-QB2]GJM61077.1 1-(5-phosphoribosyl)-5-[(5-phosphoribosylamino) methylideneamino] imidazole-4-carboxamide isomerase [Persicobacter diffluens]
MEIIPAIDLIDGQCVRLTQGDYAQKKVYESDPLKMAKSFEAAGIQRLHLVDLDGAKARKITNDAVLKRVAENTALHIDFGGGLRTDEDLKIAFESGAKQITGGSIAVKDPETFKRWIQDFGGDKIILGADVHGENIAVSGWAESSDRKLLPFLEEYLGLGLQYVICTDVSKDGLLQGPNVALYQKILAAFPEVKLIASGGVAEFDDLKRLEDIGVYGTIVGKAFYEGRISLEQLASFA